MAKESKKEGGGIGELLAYAGDRKFLTYLGCLLYTSPSPRDS